MLELLQIRLGEVAGLAVLAALGLPLLAGLVHLLEATGRLRPPSDGSARSLRTDLTYLLASPLTEAFSRTVITLVLAGIALLVGQELCPELLRGFGPVTRQPRWLIVLEMLVAGDLFYYCAHRMAHAVPFLWRFHAVHHSTPELRWVSATRSHPVEVWVQLLHILPLVLLGFPVDALASLMPLVTLYAMWIHTEQDVSLRRVSYFFNSPRFHGWHHARDVSKGTVNYAGLFPIYDVLFGTYYLPEQRPAAVGIDDASLPQTYLAQLIHPFRTRSRARARARARHAVPVHEPAETAVRPVRRPLVAHPS